MRRFFVLLVTLGFLAGACGGGDEASDEASGTTTSSSTTTTLPPFDPARPDTVLAPVGGYQYVDLPPKLFTQLNTEIRSGLPRDYKDAVKGVAAKSLTKDGQGVAVAMAFGFDPKVSALPGFQAGVAEGFKDSGSRSEPLTVGSEQATLTTDPDKTVAVAWVKGSLVLAVFGQDRPTVQTIATTIIEANKSLTFPAA
ncbi:MAG: hypothetical protein H0U41_08075 [Actinobacteria bacterium]|nr:hypothetical protein [Actinomycetota bacterium]